MSLGKYIAHNAGKFGEKASEFIGKMGKGKNAKMPETSLESMSDIVNRKLRNKMLGVGAAGAGAGALAYGMSDDDDDDPGTQFKNFLKSLLD